MPRKKATTRKTTVRKSTARKTTARKTTAKRASTRKAPAKRATARKTTAKRAPAKRATAKRAPVKRATAKRAPAKRATAKRATARKATTARKVEQVDIVAKIASLPRSAVKEAYRKSDVMRYLCEATELSKKEISAVFGALDNLIDRHLRGAGEFTIPGLAKITVKRKPATPSRKGINPFTGEPTTFKAKPARNVVKLRALKKLKEMVG